jgi:group I intron endonuclease
MNLSSTGVYIIRCVVNGKIYIGSTSTSFRKRWREHRYELLRNKHKNSHLQNAWNLHGEVSFEFSIILECLPDQCIIYEQHFLDTLTPYGTRGYNQSPTAGTTRGMVHTEETRRKVSEAVRAAYERDPTIKDRVRQAGIGRKHSPETIQKMKDSNTPELRLKKSIANLGKPKSEKTKVKMMGPKAAITKLKMSESLRKRTSLYIKKYVAKRGRSIDESETDMGRTEGKESPPRPE